MRFDQISPPLSEYPQRGIVVDLPSPTGCIFCRLGAEPTKLKRQWVHHIRREGRLVVCTTRDLKPGS